MFKVTRKLADPEVFKAQIPVPNDVLKIKEARDFEIEQILTGKSNKFLLIVGPCSADDSDAVCEYVCKLAKIAEKVSDKILVVPRIYTNKPRTNGQGYKGMLHQPDPNEPTDINAGIKAMRNLHIRAIKESGLTSADEMLYPENFMFINDLLSYHAIGARSVENQQHRLTVSGVEAPVGMKNPTSGDITVMMNSIMAAQSSHTFLYRQEEVETDGNPLAHGILRGSVNKHGENIANYHYEDLAKTIAMYEKFNLANPAIIIDLNHANSNKQFAQQPRIAKEILGNMNIEPKIKQFVKGFMVESYLVEGTQPIDGGVYGKSITDACLGFADTEKMIYAIAESL